MIDMPLLVTRTAELCGKDWNCIHWSSGNLFSIWHYLHRQRVYAHKPLKTSDNNDSFATATRIFNHTISWAVYEELDKENPIDYYSFTANKGERFYAQLLIPKLEKFINFRPSLALIGNGLSADIKNVHSENTIQEHYATDSDALPFSLPQRTEATVVDYTGIIPSTEFYEPITQTSYWERQDVVIDNLPASGTYFVVIFDRNIIHDIKDNNLDAY